jgi:hypothetical protein
MLENMNKFYIDERERLNSENSNYKTQEIENIRKVSD